MALVISSTLMAAAETVWVVPADQRKGMCLLNHSGPQASNNNGSGRQLDLLPARLELCQHPGGFVGSDLVDPQSLAEGYIPL